MQHKNEESGPIDEQPKPPEPWVPKNGDRFMIRGRVEQVCALAGTVCAALDCCDDQVFWFASKILEPENVSAPTLPISKRETLPAPPHCSECADTKGMLDAACKRIGDKDIELASALRAVDRLAAELRDERNRRRYR